MVNVMGIICTRVSDQVRSPVFLKVWVWVGEELQDACFRRDSVSSQAYAEVYERVRRQVAR